MEDEEKMLAKRLRAVRSALALNQTEFADLLDVAQSNYSRAENGFQSLSYPMILQLVYRVKVNPTWLFFGEGEMLRNPDIALGFTKYAQVKMEDKGAYTFLSIKVPKEGGKDESK